VLCVFPEKLLRDQTFRLSRLYVSVSVWSLVKCSKLVTITFQWPIGAAVLGLFQSVPYRVHRKYYVLLHTSLAKCSKLVTITFQWPIGVAVLGLFQSVPYRVHRKYYVLLHIRQLQLCFISLNVFFCYFFVKSTKR